jgi:hypothetical protein
MKKDVSAGKMIDRLLKHNDLLRNALIDLYTDDVDYIRINHLGPIHKNRSIMRAHRALMKTLPLGPK